MTSWSADYFADLKIDGQTVPVIGGSLGATLQPPNPSGRSFGCSDEVVLAPETFSQLHSRVGDTVDVDGSGNRLILLRMVGHATMPTMGSSGQLHVEMGIGAGPPDQIIPAYGRNPFDDPETGPEAILVRLRSGAGQAAAVPGLRQVADSTSTPSNFGLEVDRVQRLDEINHRSMGSTPVVFRVSPAGTPTALVLRAD